MSSAWEIRCSLPLVGALLPAISFAIPLIARESRSSFKNRSSCIEVNGVRTKLLTAFLAIMTAKSLTFPYPCSSSKIQSYSAVIFDTISPMPEYKNFSGALRIILVSTTIPYASFAGTDLRRPSTRREALALEKPSLDADVGMLINGRFRRNPQYFAPSITFPPPMPMTACVFAGMENARLVRSSNRTVSSS